MPIPIKVNLSVLMESYPNFPTKYRELIFKKMESSFRGMSNNMPVTLSLKEENPEAPSTGVFLETFDEDTGETNMISQPQLLHLKDKAIELIVEPDFIEYLEAKF